MRKILLITILISNLLFNIACAEVVTGGVSKAGAANTSRVVDSATNMPLADVRVTLPKENYQTYTDSNGQFALRTNIKGKSIMSVEKEGYRPYSLTIDDKLAAKPIVVGIERSNVEDIIVETNMLHLGDDNYSPDSANAGHFKIKSIGPFYTKRFTLPAQSVDKTNFLVIGSIVGIDTQLARSMGQNKIRNAFASAPEVYFNGTKIAEIQLNGDGQKIKLPNNLIKPNLQNEITIKTGRNLMQMAYIDYDDIELANLSIQSE